MILFKTKAALQTFYYLMAVDGEVSEDELEVYRTIGSELDAEYFEEYCKEAEENCKMQLASGIDEEDHYELVLEGIDKALWNPEDDSLEQVSDRLLVWDMLVVALSNGEYSKEERKVIKHIVRVTGMDHSIFLEMEQIIKTSQAVQKEREWIEKSDRPYAEVKVCVDELEKRQQAVLKCAMELIEDGAYEQIEKMKVPDNKMYEGAVKVGNAIASGAADIGKKAAERFGKQGKKLFGGLKNRGKDTEESVDATEE